MNLAVVILLIACCVTHLYFLYIMQQVYNLTVVSKIWQK